MRLFLSLGSACRNSSPNFSEQCVLIRFSDDTYAIGQPKEVFKAVRDIAAAARPVGLEFEPTKSTCFIPPTVCPEARAKSTREANGLKIKVKDGIIACGAAVGTFGFMTSHVKAAFVSNLKPLELVKNYGLSEALGSRQDSFLLMRYCVCPALYSFLVRTHPPSVTAPLLPQVDVDIERTVCALIDAPCEPWADTDGARAKHGFAMRLMRLDLAHGGLGFPSIGEMAGPAYLGSIALAVPICKELLTHYPKVEPISPADAFTEAAALLAGGAGAAAGVDSIDDLGVLDKPRHKLTQQLLHALKEPRFDALIASAPDKQTKVLATSFACAEAAAIYTAHPSTDPHHLRVPNHLFSVLVRQHLGFPTTDFFSGNNHYLNPLPGQGLRCIACNPLPNPLRPNMLIANDHGTHANSCEWGLARAGRVQRGYRASNLFARVCFERHLHQPAGMWGLIKEPQLARHWKLRNAAAAVDPRIARGDFALVEPGPAGKVTVVDFTVTAPDRENYLIQFPNACLTPGHAAEIAAQNKRAEYLAKWDIPANGTPLVIAAIESTGRWSPETRTLITTFLKKAFPEAGPDDHAQHYQYSRALQYVRQCVSVSVRASAADAIVALSERAHAGMLVPTALLPLA